MEVSDGANPRTNVDPMELWRQWYETGTKMWSNLSAGNGETYVDPYGIYRQWFENLENIRQQMEAGPTTNPQEVWQQWMEATTETWRRAAEIGTSMTRLMVPRWIEMVTAVQKQMLDQSGLPADPLDFYTRLYNATSGPFMKLADDILRDEAFLEISKRSFDYYALLDSIFRRASEEYFGRLQLPTVSDVTQTAGLVVALDDKVDRVEGALEDFEERLDRVESRLDQLDRLESKLDQLLAAREESGS